MGVELYCIVWRDNAQELLLITMYISSQVFWNIKLFKCLIFFLNVQLVCLITTTSIGGRTAVGSIFFN